MKAMQLHRVDRTLLDEARVAFKPRAVTPDMSHDRIMYEAGAWKVIEWLEAKIAQRASETTISAPKEEHELPNSMEGFLRRVSKGATQ